MRNVLQPIQWGATAVAVATLSACASYDVQQGIARANVATQDFSQGALTLVRTDEARARGQKLSAQLLATPVGQQEAVRLLLANSPAFQSLMARNWSEAADAAQSGRIANPVFSYESVVMGAGAEVNRFLTFGLLDLLTLPQRATIAEQRIAQAQWRLASEVVDRVTQVRQAWVRAVAAEQSFAYAQQVYDSAQNAAELARRMEAVGNFSRLARTRHQAFYADAATQLVAARQNAVSRREELVRLLGLDGEQAARLKLPPHLPSLPEQPLSGEEVSQQARRDRLDIQLARAALNAAAKAQGLTDITSMIDVELSVRRGQESSPEGATPRQGYEAGIRLPIFDWGSMRRDAMNARTLAAANDLEATIRDAESGLRERYAAYRAAYELSRHYTDEVLPLRKVMADENRLRYNGMLIGVFELLADARDQAATVISAIAAQQQFWLADAALRANLIGRPVSAGFATVSTISSGASADD